LHKKPRSYLRNEASTKVLKAFFGATTPAKQIQLADVSRFIVQRRRARKVPVHNQQRSGAPVSSLHLGGETWLVAHHPVKGIGYLRVKPKERYLSREEIRLLLDACSDDLRDLVTLSLGTGMRASEDAHLDRDHTDLKRGMVTLVDTRTVTVVSCLSLQM